MNFKGRFLTITAIILLLGLFIQFTRMDIYLNTSKNKNIIEFSNKDNNKSTNMHLGQKSLIVYSDQYETYEREKSNFSYMFSYMKKDYDVIKFDKFAHTDISEYSNIILLIENNIHIGGNNKIFNFVKRGGKVLYGNNLHNSKAIEDIKSQIGVEEVSKEAVMIKSLKFLENVMIKSKGVEIKEDNRVHNISYDINLIDSAKVYITSDNDIPLLWKNNYGSGEVFYFNGTMLQEKSSRGLIAGIISTMYKNDIYPVINSKVNFIDDFPSPTPSGTNESIESEYGVTIDKFYTSIWWKDMVKISALNNIKYTGVVIGTYSDETNDLSKTKIDIDEKSFEYYARELLFQKGEIGIHGYNHQPLIVGSYIDEKYEYSLWKNDLVMSDSIFRLKNFINSILKDYRINVYVPPSNILSEEGIQAILNSSDIKVLCSLYDKDQATYGYVQEFRVRDNGVIEMPRITFGYFFYDSIRWDILNSINLYGYFSHFVHPDDILDVERNKGRSFEEMKNGYSEIQSYVNSEFSWIVADTATEAANKLQNYLECGISYEKQEDFIKIYLQNFDEPVSFILKTDKKIDKSQKCTSLYIDDNTYLINTSSAESIVYLK